MGAGRGAGSARDSRAAGVRGSWGAGIRPPADCSPGAQTWGQHAPLGCTYPGAQAYAAPGPSGQGWVAGSAPGWAPHGFAPAPAVAGAGPGEALHWVLPVGRSWQSVVAGYLGLFSMLVWVLAPFSIGVGIWALARARQGGHGRGRAITGIVGGLIGAVLGIAMLAGAFR